MEKKKNSSIREYDWKTDPTYTLVVYLHGVQQPELWHSFDGRRNLTDTSPKTFDDPKYWTPENGFKHLVKHFNDKWSANSNVKMAFIRGKAFGSPQEAVWNGSDFVKPSAIKPKQKPTPSVKPDDKHYIFRLGVPLDDGTWQNFYSSTGIDKVTGEIDESDALNDVTAQFAQWSKLLNCPAYNSQGWVYGGNGVYSRTNPPKSVSKYWFDCKQGVPKYHQSQRVVQMMISENY